MSGTLIIQSAAADMSAKPSQIILPGTLSLGLIGHFYTNTSLTQSIVNLAPGAPQVASITGTPTLGPGYINLQVGTTYINTGLLETPALTIIMATQTVDPMVTTDVYFTSCLTADASQGTGNVGSSLYSLHNSTPSSVNLNGQSYSGASFATKAPVTGVLTANAANAWFLAALTVQAVAPYLVKTRNLTTSRSGQATTTNPRQINTVAPFLIGSRPGLGASGTLRVASYSLWNRDLSDAECIQMRQVVAPYLSDKFGIIV